MTPLSNTDQLTQLFANTTTTYKYYWFLSLLDKVVVEEQTKIPLIDLAASMVILAHPVTQNKEISLGAYDSLRSVTYELTGLFNLANIDILEEPLLNNMHSKEVQNSLSQLLNHVPYRFLSPWIKFSTKKEVAELSQQFHNGCIYAITDEYIEINPDFISLLKENYHTLRGFTTDKLLQFLNRRNPDKQGIRIQ